MNMLLYNTVLGCAVVIGSCIIFAASYYDLRAAAKRSRLTATQRRLRGIQQPRVAVLIDASGTSLDGLPACLDSVIKSRYQQLTICIVDDHRGVAKQFIKTYRQHHPSKQLRYYAPRRVLSPSDRLHSAYRQLQKHDILLVLDANNTISPIMIKQAVAHFSDAPQLGSLQLAHRSKLALSLTSLLMRYDEASSEILRKATPHLPRTKPLHTSANALYRHSYFVANVQNATCKTYYSASLVTTTHTSTPIKSPRYPLLIWPISVISVYLLTVAFATAATLQNSSVLLLTWLSICLWMLDALWTENAAPTLEKVILTYGVLLTPLFLYLRAAWLTVILPINGLRWLMRQWHRTRHNTNRYSYQRYVLDNILSFKTWYEEVCPREVWYQDQRRTDD